MFLKNRLRRLRSQLLLIFLVGFPGLGLAIGIPVILLLDQQSSSHAQLLLEQAVVASRAFMRREQSDLQSLALLISQRPTLTQLLNQQDLPPLEEYLNTLRESADLDLRQLQHGRDSLEDVDRDVRALLEGGEVPAADSGEFGEPGLRQVLADAGFANGITEHVRNL